jgi:predicted membrane channel-forming protein YqfA (hemolysin III family)
MDDGTIVRRIAALMAFEAATLVVASIAHLSGNVHGRSEPFNAEHAGIAEAIIGTVLACGAVTMMRGSRRASAFGLATTGFAIAGFLVGLNFTARGGDLPDVAYHVTMLPVLMGTLVTMLRMRQSGSRSAVSPEGRPPSGVVTPRR